MDLLPPFHFAPLATCLVTLNLAGNKLTRSGLSDTSLQMDPEQHLSRPWVLETLSLADNRLHSLPADIFGQLGKLQSLDLSSNPLSEMEAATIQAIGVIASLTSLSLADCRLASLSHGLLDGLTQLETLDLSGNPLTMIDPRLRSAPSITSLIFDRSYKCLFHPSILNFSVHEVVLNFLRSHIQHLDHNSFVGLDDLRNLSISRLDLAWTVIRKLMIMIRWRLLVIFMILRIVIFSSPFLRTVESGTFDPLYQV